MFTTTKTQTTDSAFSFPTTVWVIPKGTLQLQPPLFLTTKRNFIFTTTKLTFTAKCFSLSNATYRSNKKLLTNATHSAVVINLPHATYSPNKENSPPPPIVPTKQKNKNKKKALTNLLKDIIIILSDENGVLCIFSRPVLKGKHG